MDQKQIFKQMLNFNKSSFNNAFSTLVMAQEQMETMGNSLVDQAAWLPAEGKKAIQDWLGACKKGREEYKKLIDDAYKKVEAFL
ncbi:MAG: hypothetical protein C4522_04375 [Desulfobacteraceae bacterium]|nr:MAG: hypothetical protein C4522_04375 [Desulfobacteraceae bacterium]